MAELQKVQKIALEKGKVLWLGDAGKSLGELHSSMVPLQKGGSKIDLAKSLLIDLLPKGPVPALDALEVVQINGISERTYKRARKELNIESENRQGQWIIGLKK